MPGRTLLWVAGLARREFVRGGSGSARNRRSTQASCVGATVFFTTWLRLNLPPPRQARWEAAPRGKALSLATELVPVENRLDAVGMPHASVSHAPLATELVPVENRLDAEAPLSHWNVVQLSCEVDRRGSGGRTLRVSCIGVVRCF